MNIKPFDKATYKPYSSYSEDNNDKAKENRFVSLCRLSILPGAGCGWVSWLWVYSLAVPGVPDRG